MNNHAYGREPLENFPIILDYDSIAMKQFFRLPGGVSIYVSARTTTIAADTMTLLESRSINFHGSMRLPDTREVRSAIQKLRELTESEPS